MNAYKYTPFLIFVLGNLILGMTLYFALYKVQFSNNRLLKKIFYEPSPKSHTGAILLGGLPMTVMALINIFALIKFNNELLQLNDSQILLLRIWPFPVVLVTLYGYLDDRIEIRPVLKLIFQFGPICFFSYFAARILTPTDTALGFILLTMAGLGLANGSNLVDGLDSLALKVATVTLFIFFTIGSLLHESSIMGLSISFLPLPIAFYFFNKEPAKIHMGEIGSCLLGLTFMLLATFVFMKGGPKIGGINAFALSLIPMCVYELETFLSMSRRSYNRKSMFVGDKLHIHYLLRDKYNFSPSDASTALASITLLTSFIALAFFLSFNALIGFMAVTILQSGTFILIANKDWIQSGHMKLELKDLTEILKKKEVVVMDRSDFDQFEFKIHKKIDKKPQEKLSDDKNKKKAA
jgi:UDP-N-acetylmuramyl pentapeptide phosphotransferase/UDP-N-acetylglucosamine-1-phosphate transferase